MGNGTALPDITLVPQIANFFGVSADELLCMKETEETEELSEKLSMDAESLPFFNSIQRYGRTL